MAIRDKSTWERPTIFHNQYTKAIVYSSFAFVFLWSLLSMEFSISRFIAGVSEITRLVDIVIPPNFEHRFLSLYWQGIYESFGIAVLATIGGVFISIPFAFMGAGNIAPKPIYYFARGIFVFTRAFHSLIVAIVFVLAFGTGALAGVLTFIFGTVGYWAKLLAEDIEDIADNTINSIRAVGASPLQVILYSIVPQIMPRAVGLTIYRWDQNLRGSVIIGIVGAGGIGLTLINSYRRFEYDVTAAIIIIIVAIVMVGELASSYIRGRVQ